MNEVKGKVFRRTWKGWSLTLFGTGQCQCCLKTSQCAFDCWLNSFVAEPVNFHIQKTDFFAQPPLRELQWKSNSLIWTSVALSTETITSKCDWQPGCSWQMQKVGYIVLSFDSSHPKEGLPKLSHAWPSEIWPLAWRCCLRTHPWWELLHQSLHAGFCKSLLHDNTILSELCCKIFFRTLMQHVEWCKISVLIQLW